MIGEVTFGVIGLLFLFADIRTFASTFQQTFFGAPNANLAIMATSVFATSFLGVFVAWRLNAKRAVGSSAALLAGATFLCTASRNNWIDLFLVTIALAGGFWWLALLHSARVGESSSPFARALPIAFVCDVALRAAFRTIAVPDLAWPVAVGIVAVGALVFAAAGFATLAPERHWSAPGSRGIAGLLVVPCLVLVAESGATNGAQAALASGLGLGPEPARATQIGELAIGVGLAAGLLLVPRLQPRGPLAAALVGSGAALLWLHLTVVSLVGGAILAAGAVLAAAALLGAPLRPARSPLAVGLALSFGWILFVATAFGFYAFWAFYPAVYAATALVAFGALLAPSTRIAFPVPAAVAVMLVAIVVPLFALVATPAAAEPLAPRATFRLMTYNIHQGFNAGQIPSLDNIVDVASRESPDVLCLQEVARGWMIDEQHDALSYIAERLGMRYAWFPAMGDLYGDAILSRFDMADRQIIRYAAPGFASKHQPRGAIGVKVSGVTVVCTHLDDVSDATHERQDQVRMILDTWTGSPTVIAGDMNAKPDAIEIQLYGQSGFDDLGAPAGETTTGDNPQKRIDYVFGKGVIGSQAHAPTVADAVPASDHRWLVVNITISK
ncbi:MAG TPA: endonuclease/exonuclease/phosphatase family protein [Candidatus Limnocylindria bacterium]